MAHIGPADAISAVHHNVTFVPMFIQAIERQHFRWPVEVAEGRVWLSDLYVSLEQGALELALDLQGRLMK